MIKRTERQRPFIRVHPGLRQFADILAKIRDDYSGLPEAGEAYPLERGLVG